MNLPAGYAMPQIPGDMMHTMYELIQSGEYDAENGGLWSPGEDMRVPFQGVVLPVTSTDLRRDTAGAYTACSQKVYTNGHSLHVGGRICDPQEDICYTVTQELGHNSLHPLKRYLLEARGGQNDAERG